MDKNGDARQRHEAELEAEIEQLKEQLEARKVIDRAKSVLMTQGMTEQEAFSRLQKTSMDTRRPLREIAEAVLISAQVTSHNS